MDRNREKEGWRMQCFMKKDDKGLIDHVETTSEMCRSIYCTTAIVWKWSLDGFTG